MQTVYINKLLNSHQLSNYNLTFRPMVKKLCLALAHDNFNPNQKHVSAYKQFTGSL